jgi:hypothetical protein
MTGYAPSDRGGSAVTRTMPGYHVGAVLTALLALVLVDRVGWPGDSDVVKGRSSRSAWAVGGVLHGAAAGRRAEHLAAEDHGGRGLLDR